MLHSDHGDQSLLQSGDGDPVLYDRDFQVARAGNLLEGCDCILSRPSRPDVLSADSGSPSPLGFLSRGQTQSAGSLL